MESRCVTTVRPSRLTNTLITTAFIATLAAESVGAQAKPDITRQATFATKLADRFGGDRSGACVAAALIRDGGTVVYRATTCADPSQNSNWSDVSTFEIGSITKTMTAMLVADLIEQGKMQLDDPLVRHLPSGSKAPTMNGKQITLRHVMTHTSGLPALPQSDLPSTEAEARNPYSKMTAQGLLADLATATLVSEPGSQSSYSNFAMMLLSMAITHTAQRDLDLLLKEKLFDPLGMRTASVSQPSPDARPLQGHSNGRKPTPAWTISPNLAGVGMVRASLNDMIAYAKANLSLPTRSPKEAAVHTWLAATHAEQFKLPSGNALGMNWQLRKLPNGRQIIEHGGGTYGFTSYIAIDKVAGSAVVLLADTGSVPLGRFGDHLLDPTVDGGVARRLATPSDDLLKAIQGDYEMAGIPFTVRLRNGKLYSQALGQPEIELAYDSTGDFFPLHVDAIVRPTKTGDRYTLTLLQGGAVIPLVRASEVKASAPRLPAEKLREFEGVYPLFSGLKLKVFEKDGRLMAQATGQGAFVVDSTGDDAFAAQAFGINLQFKRDANGKVIAMAFKQGPNAVTSQKE